LNLNRIAWSGLKGYGLLGENEYVSSRATNRVLQSGARWLNPTLRKARKEGKMTWYLEVLKKYAVFTGKRRIIEDGAQDQL
jgi:hypothetical protein